MEINREREKVFFFRDFFFHVLYRWRSLLLAGLIGAILLGGLQYFTLRSIHADGGRTQEELQYEIDLQNYHDSLEACQVNIRTYTKLIKENNDYMAESVYMQLDSQDVWTCSRSYFIKVDDAVMAALPEGSAQDPADYVAVAYANTLKSQLDEGEMEALMGTGRTDYIDELVKITADANTNTIALQVIGPDRETVEKQMDYFVDRLENRTARTAQAVAAHALVLMSENTVVRTDPNLSAKQEKLSTDTAAYQLALQENRQTLNQLQDKGEPAEPGDHIKRNAAIGFVGGAALLAVVYAMMYLLNGRLRVAEDLTCRYDLPIYGDFAAHRARRPGFFVDKWLDGLEFRGRVIEPDVIAMNVCALLKENYSGKRVLLAGAMDGDRLKPLYDRLCRGVDGAVALEMAPDFLRSGEAVGRAGEVDGVLLAVEKYRDGIGDIDRMAETLNIAGAKVAGCVAL